MCSLSLFLKVWSVKMFIHSMLHKVINSIKRRGFSYDPYVHSRVFWYEPWIHLQASVHILVCEWVRVCERGCVYVGVCVWGGPVKLQALPQTTFPLHIQLLHTAYNPQSNTLSEQYIQQPHSVFINWLILILGILLSPPRSVFPCKSMSQRFIPLILQQFISRSSCF